MIVEYNQQSFQLTRYPKTSNRSLQAMNAGDEYLLETLADLDIQPESVAIFNDRFGVLTCLLHSYQPFTVIDYRSQEKACRLNLETNKLSVEEKLWVYSPGPLPASIEMGVIRVPKSLDLFRFYLYQLSQILPEDGIVYCSFMTRHFTTKLLDIAGEYFEEVQQSRAWKKSRLLTLQKRKPFQEKDFIHSIKMNEQINLKQYPGVFSSGGIDLASRFLMESFQKVSNVEQILDLASGNGLLAMFMRQQYPEANIHLLDDSRLAVESSRLNLLDERSFFYWDEKLEIFEPDSFDLVISNPPFHFEYETNIEVALTLFCGVEKCLKTDGVFQMVASKHLNYKTHLEKLFRATEILSENDKFVVYLCRK